ncbi:MAG: hypothetical protein IJL63_07270 [Clostridia bacterium]|nr:hypothetical protein [Clostridia bacterium]
MGKIFKACISIVLAAVTFCVLFASCGEPEQYTPVSVTTTETTTVAPDVIKYSDYEVFGAKMGMSIEEAEQSVGGGVQTVSNDTGTLFFALWRKNLPFTVENEDTLLYYIFDGRGRLCEIQYAITNKEHFSLSNALKFYDGQYGKHVEYEASRGKMNYIWYKGGVYILITDIEGGETAMSFVAEDYFNQLNPEEAGRYAELQQQNAQ